MTNYVEVMTGAAEVAQDNNITHDTIQIDSHWEACGL